MKTKLALAALAVTLAAPAFAQSFDVATATCGEFAALDADTMGTMLLWIDGYTGGVAGDSRTSSACGAAVPPVASSSVKPRKVTSGFGTSVCSRSST